MGNQANDNQVFTVIRTFDASQQEVFNAFSNADALNEWWGPAETKNSVIKLDFQPGGIFHFKMESEYGVNYGRFLFGRIEPYHLLEFSNAFADENANVVKAPFDMPLPDEIFYQIVFKEDRGKTTLTLTGKAVNPTAEEQETFDAIQPDMQNGFRGTFDQLEKYLAKTENQSR
jgi:uncharacterized protein YndB with AHSA1/START domain